MAERINFGKLKEVLDIPDLIGIQIKSYEDFLQKNGTPEERKPGLDINGLIRPV